MADQATVADGELSSLRVSGAVYDAAVEVSERQAVPTGACARGSRQRPTCPCRPTRASALGGPLGAALRRFAFELLLQSG